MLGQPATWPLCEIVYIKTLANDSRETLRWPIVAYNPAGVLCEDVLRALHLSFTEALWPTEWDEITEERKELIGRAWQNRNARRARVTAEDALNGITRPSTDDGVLRLDYLLEHTYFRGLSACEDGLGWILHMGAPGH
jgi:hypothetical protein